MKKILLILLLPMILFAQDKDAKKILEKVKSKFHQVKDYQVDVSIKVNMDFIKMPDTKAHIYFKQPDKVSIKSEGFAMLPKQGLNFSPLSLLNGDYDAIFAGQEKYENADVFIIKIIPRSDSSNYVLTKLKIDSKDFVVRHIESVLRQGNSYNIEMHYGNNLKYSLPEKLVFSFNVKAGQEKQTQQPQDNRRKRNMPKKGNVTISYTNYVINKGIDDAIFDKKKKK